MLVNVETQNDFLKQLNEILSSSRGGIDRVATPVGKLEGKHYGLCEIETHGHAFRRYLLYH